MTIYLVIFLLALLVSLILTYSKLVSPYYSLPRIIGRRRFNLGFKNREIFRNTLARDFKARAIKE